MLRRVVCSLAHFTLMSRFCVAHTARCLPRFISEIKVLGLLEKFRCNCWSGPIAAGGDRHQRVVFAHWTVNAGRSSANEYSRPIPGNDEVYMSVKKRTLAGREG
jgi:hypothetical protein